MVSEHEHTFLGAILLIYYKLSLSNTPSYSNLTSSKCDQEQGRLIIKGTSALHLYQTCTKPSVSQISVPLPFKGEQKIHSLLIGF